MLEAAATDFAWRSAADIASAVARGQTSALAVVEATLARIRARDPLLNSFTAMTPERARRRAQALDAARAAGQPIGPLGGVPFAVKNLFDVEGLPTLAGSRSLAVGPRRAYTSASSLSLGPRTSGGG